MMDQLIARAEILIRQRKLAEAGKLLENALSIEPNNIRVLAMLSEIKLHEDKNSDAFQLINSAIGLSPDTGYLYYIKARIHINEEQYNDAEEQLRQAITLNAWDAASFALWASVKLTRKNYEEALRLADESLQRDPENILGLNIRSTALLKLDRKEESFATIEGALAEDPDNAYTHANYGWSLLEQGNHKKALEHFREALRINPSFDYAKSGMAEALKGRYLLYRLFLKYVFWISNLAKKNQWAVIIGFYILFRLLRGIAENSELLRPYIIPLIILLAIIAFSTWVMHPLSNLFLRFNQYGKYLLDKKEIQSSNLVGISFLIFITGGVTYAFTSDERWLIVTIVGFAMMVPLGIVFSSKKYAKVYAIYTIGMFAIGVAAIANAFVTNELFNVFAVAFVIAFGIFQWVANYLRIKESNK